MLLRAALKRYASLLTACEETGIAREDIEQDCRIAAWCALARAHHAARSTIIFNATRWTLLEALRKYKRRKGLRMRRSG